MSSAALQTAVYGVLTGDSTLLALLSSSWGVDAVFSDVPSDQYAEDDAFYPFVSFGPSTKTRFDTKTNIGGNETMQINVWTRSNDYVEAKTVAARIETLLHRQDLTITGATHVLTHVESIETTIDPDGHTRRALMQLRIIYYT